MTLINNILKNKIKEVYHSQTKFGKEIGLGKTHISRVITGQSTLGPYQKMVWAAALHTKVELIFPGTIIEERKGGPADNSSRLIDLIDELEARIFQIKDFIISGFSP